MTLAAVVFTPVDARNGAERWRVLRELLGRLDRLAQVSLVIDLDGTGQAHRLMQTAMFEQELQTIQQLIDHEITQITVEALHADLLLRRRRDDEQARKRR